MNTRIPIRLPGKKSKYRNVRVQVDGIWFDSKKEAKRYSELIILERENSIASLIVHPVFEFKIEGRHICSYEGDFSYWVADGDSGPYGKPVIEDVKGHRTREYLIKKKLMKAVYGIDIVEI